MRLAGEQDELLPTQQALHALAGPFELLLAHGVEGFQEVADDMELVVDDGHPRAVRLKAPLEGLL
jgi:hypothetical protein